MCLHCEFLQHLKTIKVYTFPFKIAKFHLLWKSDFLSLHSRKSYCSLWIYFLNEACTLYILNCTLYTWHSVHSILCSIQNAVYSIQNAQCITGVLDDVPESQISLSWGSADSLARATALQTWKKSFFLWTLKPWEYRFGGKNA